MWHVRLSGGGESPIRPLEEVWVTCLCVGMQPRRLVQALLRTGTVTVIYTNQSPTQADNSTSTQWECLAQEPPGRRRNLRRPQPPTVRSPC